MKVKIKRVWDAKLDKYKDVLDRYNARYEEDEEYEIRFAIIEIKDIKELFSLSKELKQDLIIDHYSKDDKIDIYDDYIE